METLFTAIRNTWTPADSGEVVNIDSAHLSAWTFLSALVNQHVISSELRNLVPVYAAKMPQ